MINKINTSYKHVLAYLDTYHVKFIFIILSVLMLDAVYKIPYINIFFSQELFFLLEWIIIINVLEFSHNVSFYMALLLLGFAMLLMITKSDQTAEKMGNFAFIVFTVGLGQAIWSNLRKAPVL